MIILYLILIILGLIISKKKDNSVFSPLGFFTILWGLSLVLFEISPRPYQTLNNTTYILIILSWIFYMMGYLFYQQSLSNNHQNYNLDAKINKKALFLITITIFLGLLGSLLFVRNLLNYISNPQLIFIKSQEIRQLYFSNDSQLQGNAFENTYTMTFVYTAAIFSGILINRYPKKYILYLPIFSAILYDIAFVGRIFTISTAFFMFIGYRLTKKYFNKNYVQARKQKDIKRKRKIPIYIKVIVLFSFCGLILFITSSRSNIYINIYESLYSYFTGSWTVLDFYLNNLSLHTNGASTFYPIVYLFYKLGIWFEDPSKHLGSVYYVLSPYGSNLNTFTIITPIYNDFGPIGVMIFFIIFGFLSAKYYNDFIKKGKFNSIVPLIWIYYTILISIVGFPFVSIAIFVGLIITIILSRFIFTKC